jgi:hypothetical protein
MTAWPTIQSWRNTKAAGGFSPLQLTSLRGWWKSDVGITIATGVSAWADQSTNGNTLLQATGGAQPTLTAGQINGLPAVVFDGVDDTISATFTLAKPTTVFIVMSQPTWTNADRLFDGKTANDSLLLQQSGAPNGILISSGGASTGNTMALALATFGLVTCVFNGASSSIQVNSVAAVTGTVGATAAGGFTIGSRAAPLAFGNIAVAEVIVMAAVATAAEITSVKAYIAARYGIAT